MIYKINNNNNIYMEFTDRYNRRVTYKRTKCFETVGWATGKE